MSKQITIAIAGCGARGRYCYGRLAMEFPDMLKIVALADTDATHLADTAAEFGVASDMCFNSVEEMLTRDKLADVMFICTQDRQHVGHAIPAMRAGYHLLLEKPVSPNLDECLEVERVARETGREVCVCHVLRYTQFYGEIKSIIESGEIGDVVNIEACEGVGFWHQAHSYVRGNWRDSASSSPMILAKSCHDMDILLWLSGHHCESVSSIGSLYEFKAERAPQGSAMRCYDGCKVRDTCPYDAEKIYITGPIGIIADPKVGWPQTVVCDNPTVETLTEALKTGPYGRCVYHCDNNVVDHQSVNMRMDNNMTVSFTMSAFAAKVNRTIRIMGTMGEISGDMENRHITVSPFIGEPREIELETLPDDFTGHGGGDKRMLAEFAAVLSGGSKKDTSLTSISASLESHYVALAAEKSRLNDGARVVMSEFKK